MKLSNDLYAIDKTLLVKAGDIIDRKALNKIACLSESISYTQIKDTWLMKDFIQTFEDERYTKILYPPETNQKIIRNFSRIKMPEKIFAELANMKKLSSYTYHHSLIVTVLAGKICFDRSLQGKYTPDMAMILGLLHDLGKSRIPVSSLNKTTPLTSHEWHVLKKHPLIGYILLHYYFGNVHKQYSFPTFQHHERLDGSGYPRQIKKINKYSQVIAVVDTLDALLSGRPYRSKPYTLRAAIDHLLDEAEKGKLNKRMAKVVIVYSRQEMPSAKIILGERGRDKAPAKNIYGIIEKS